MIAPPPKTMENETAAINKKVSDDLVPKDLRIVISSMTDKDLELMHSIAQLLRGLAVNEMQRREGKAKVKPRVSDF